MSKLSALKDRFSQKNDTVSANSSPEATKIATGSALLILKLLASKQFDHNGVTVVIGRQFADPALPDQWIGQEVAIGDLKAVHTDTRPNGTSGSHYPILFSLSMAQADKIISHLEGRPAKSRSGFQPPKVGNRQQSAQPTAAPQAADSGLAAEVASLKADMSALIEILAEKFAEPAPVEPVQGHAKVAEPAQPVQVTGPVYRPGDVILVTIDGETVARQITVDGKRLNKTIV